MSKELLEYNGYSGSVEISIKDGCAHGKILFINDLVTYESDSIPQLKCEFEDAVDDYLETCKEVGKDPDKSLTGSFNARIGGDLHKKAVLRAIHDDVSLNKVLICSMEMYLNGASEIHNHLNVNIHKDKKHESDVLTSRLTVRKPHLWAVENKLHA